jgi:catechol 2,3-dioxygenase-like lactoylglutathione lyase family enzyme
MQLDHVNVRCSSLQASSDFFESVVGLKPGPRPPFNVPGCWLYDDSGRAVVHLLATLPASADPGPVDHVAFRCDNLSLPLKHLAGLGYECTPMVVPGTPIYQCFVTGPDGLQIEFQGPLPGQAVTSA